MSLNLTWSIPFQANQTWSPHVCGIPQIRSMFGALTKNNNDILNFNPLNLTVVCTKDKAVTVPSE